MRIIITSVLLSTFFSGILDKAYLTEDEKELYKLIKEYRAENNLPEIPLSPSLSIVAQTHAKDLALNNPTSNNCNAHSWSAQGKWKKCCYSSDHKNAECMWLKPQELTNYKGYGYEIVTRYTNNDPELKITPSEALSSWKKSYWHNIIIVNKRSWKDMKWNAIGIGMYRGVASVWFGEEEDSKGK